MRTTGISLKTVILALGDVALFLAAIWGALLIRHGGTPDASIADLYAFAAPFLVFLWAGGFFIFGLYDLKAAKNTPWFYDRLGRALLLNLGATALLFYTFPEFGLRPLITLFVMF